MKRVDREHYDGTKDWKNYYWFYYKWHILGAILLVATIVICTAQCATKVNPDYYILFYSDTYITDQFLDTVTDEIAEFSDDLNGDGEVKVQAVNCSYSPSDMNLRSVALQKAILQMQNTDSCIWVLDDKGVDAYYESEEIDLFAEHECLNEFENHAINAKELKGFSTLSKNAGDMDFYVFCRKDAQGKISKVGSDIIYKAAK